MLIFQNSKTLFFLFLIAFAVLFVDGMKVIQQRYTGRVVGGRLADHENFPFIVSLQKCKGIEEGGKQWIHICGGSIVNPSWVLTACHCVAHTKENPRKYKDASKYRIVAGVTSWHDNTPERQEVGAKQFYAHSQCNKRGLARPYTYYDIGLVELLFPLVYSFQVQPVKLFSRDLETAFRELRRLEHKNALCLSPGWGRIQQCSEIKLSPHLKVADQILHTTEECHEILCNDKDTLKGYFNMFPEGKCSDLNKIEQVCVTSKNASICKGDSGGPLVCNGYIFGVVSQVGSLCKYGGTQIFSDIRSILNVVNEYIPDTEYYYEDFSMSGGLWDTMY